MKIKVSTGAAFLAAVTLLTVTSVKANTIDDNATITAIYGSGNPDNGWTSSTGGGSTLALNADNRTTGFVPNVDNGTYAFDTGTAPANPARALWNFAFSVQSAGSSLTVGPTVGTPEYWLSINGAVTLAPVNLALFNDNAYGNASTLNGGGTVGLYSTLASGNSKLQNSENDVFFGADPNAAGVYNISLFETLAFPNAVPSPNGTHVNEVDIQVDVGTVPDTASTGGLMAAGIGGLMFLRRKLTMA